MAGGIGTRFWPQSTPDNPKQFLSLLNEKSMLQMTYERINKLIPSDRIFIITNYNYIDKIKKQIPDIKDLNIITEPCSKNTAPCILLSTIYIRNIYKNANVVCISSDSYIKNEEKFINDIVLANEFVNNNTNAIVTIGIEPTRAETGYGYIKFEPSSSKVLKVSKFVEKPNLELANEYYQSKKYLWNAGMFIFNVKNMLEECKVNIPNEYNLLINLPDFSNPKYYEFLNKAYNDCTKISIDYAIMEKSKNVYTIPTNIVENDTSYIEHEATVSKVSEEQLFYLMSRGLTEEQATEMIVMGFIEPFAKELPMEYAVELNQLIKLEMKNSIG